MYMAEKRINIIIPEALYQRAVEMINKGFYSNVSEMVREGLRKQVLDYENIMDKLRENKEFLLRAKK